MGRRAAKRVDPAPEAIAEFVRDWGFFCDGDRHLLVPDFEDRMEAAGLITLRKVTRADVREDAFAAERGIELGGWLWEPTDAGRAALSGEGGGE